MSELFQHVAMMSRLQVDMSNIFMPAPITPPFHAVPLSDNLGQEAHDSGAVLPFVSQVTGD